MNRTWVGVGNDALGMDEDDRDGAVIPPASIHTEEGVMEDVVVVVVVVVMVVLLLLRLVQEWTL